MNDLLDLQNKFQQYLFNNDLSINSHINDTQKISRENRLAIYQNAYYLRLTDALAANYPVLKIILDADHFNELAHEYLKQYTSIFRSIRWFGDNLPSFLLQHITYSKLPYLSELAQFEWAMTTVFDAADGPILKIEEIAAIKANDWYLMRFNLHPSVRQLDLIWNVVEIWQSIINNESSPLPSQNNVTTKWILWRNNLNNKFCSISESEAWAINRILDQAPFGEICEGLCQWIDDKEAGMHAASLLKSWIQSGILSQVIL